MWGQDHYTQIKLNPCNGSESYNLYMQTQLLLQYIITNCRMKSSINRIVTKTGPVGNYTVIDDTGRIYLKIIP